MADRLVFILFYWAPEVGGQFGFSEIFSKGSFTGIYRDLYFHGWHFYKDVSFYDIIGYDGSPLSLEDEYSRDVRNVGN
jgi:hypothetical protein